ncbi:MAG TPA: M1 family metallopeptidase [Gemmatimonadales bacterium]
MRPTVLATALWLACPAVLAAQETTTRPSADTVAQAPRREHVSPSSRADTLRGSFTTPGRRWWDVTFYDLHVAVSPADSSIRGRNGITYRVLEPAREGARGAHEMQIDLMVPLEIDSIVQDGQKVRFRREGNAFFATLTAPQQVGQEKAVTVYYHGRPQVAETPPWEGGITWATDSLGRQWIVTTDQGLGASVWWPNKDTQADEPDSQRVALRVPDPLVAVANGRLRGTTRHDDGTTTYEWFVTNPINNYAININAGHYAHFADTYEGLGGELTLDFWPLDYNVDRARRQWVPQARSMLACFEHWFGPYPFYEDGYKLIEVPYAGMEHQSAVTYGNRFEDGYLGRDASGTGLGLQWDFILVHESAHEWFANNITSKDQADMWVHESFTNYAEAIYTECLFGRDAGARYVIGSRRAIRNDRPIIPAYGVNDEGSGDMYIKGGNMLHTIRQVVGDDARWRDILRGLNREFRHQTVMGSQVEAYVSREAGVDLGRVFEQYLRTTMIPELEYRVEGDTLHYRWANVVPGFDMPVRATLVWPLMSEIHPTTEWQSIAVRLPNAESFRVDESYYVTLKRVEAAAAAAR